MEETPAGIEDERTRMLAYLISRADSLASGERPESESKGYKPLAALESVFSQIDIGESIDNDKEYRYPLGVLYKDSIRPDCELQEHSQDKYEAHCDRFINEFKAIVKQPYENMADTLLSLIQKYLWCIPSDTTISPKDISLSDHLKVTCALAACFYKYFEEAGWSEEAVKDDSQVRLRLVCGDISGIQNYIYNTASVEHGGVAKRLRGRSFRVALLTEAIALRIIRGLDLPMACKVMSAGGQFYLLIPNTEAYAKKLADIVESISEWLIDEYKGEIGVSIASIELPNYQLKQQQFDIALRKINSEVAKEKSRKFSSIINKGPKVFELNYEGRQSCPVCDRNPAKDNSNDSVCENCDLDADLGRALASGGDVYLVISKTRLSGAVSIPLFGNDWHANIVEGKPDSIEAIMAYNLRSSDLLLNVPCAFALHAGYVPRWKNIEDYNKMPEDIKKNENYNEEYIESGRAVKSFSSIAHSSEGVRLIGVLRADADHLGLIFSLGLKGKASLSRISTLSSLFGSFFSFELTKLIENEFQETYVVYSGGDDLILIGPWDQTILLSKRINEEFSDYTCQNPNITLSAGIGTFQPKVPIAVTSVITGELLEKSKSEGRNSLTIFDTTFKWPKFDDVKGWVDALNTGIRTNNGDEKKNIFEFSLQAS